jgi:hypothetical protein
MRLKTSMPVDIEAARLGPVDFRVGITLCKTPSLARLRVRLKRKAER